MNDFDSIFVQVAVEKKMLNAGQAKRAQELIEAAKGSGSTGELLVKNGLLNSMQVKDILHVQMERIRSGNVTPNAKPSQPAQATRDDGPSMTLMVNAADLFGGAMPTPAGGKPKAAEDPGSQTLALNFNDIMNAPAASAGKPAEDPGSQTLALNAIDLFGSTAPPPQAASKTTTAGDKPSAGPAKPATPTAKPAAAPAPFDPPPMQTLALNAADLFGGNVPQAGAKLSSVRNESGQGAVTAGSSGQAAAAKPAVPAPAAAAPAAPKAPLPAHPPAREPEAGGQTLQLNAADLFGGMVVSSEPDATPGRATPQRSAPAGTERRSSGSGTAKPPPGVTASNTQPAKPEAAAPKADVLNAFDIFGLPADAPSAPPIQAPAKPAAPPGRGGKVPETSEDSNTLSLNAADLFGSSSGDTPAPVLQRQPPARTGSAALPPGVQSSPSNPPIEPPMPGREPKSGQIYGTTRIIKRLGEGNMAIVFMGENMETKQQIAVKFLKPEVGANSTSVKRFVREAESAQKIKHPNVLETYRVSEFSGWHYMEMELMIGEDIRGMMKRGTVPLAQALTLCLEAAAGLQAAHDQGVIHRDIKPENLMIMQAGGLKIADFGLARVQEAAGLTMPGQMLGTPAYMAPEQWEGKTPDARTDIYALGVTLYDMVTGRRPVEGTTAGAIIQTLFGKGPTPIEQVNPSLPKSVTELVNQMVKVNPDDRPASMAEVRKRMLAAQAEVAGTPDPTAMKKDETLGATMVTDESSQAELQAELKALRVAKDGPASGKKPVEDEATMKMAPGELEKVLAHAPSPDEIAKAASREDATMAMSTEDVEAMKRGLAETEIKKDKVSQKTDDGGAVRKLLIGAIVLVVLGILAVVGVAAYFFMVE